MCDAEENAKIEKKKLTPAEVLTGESPLVLTATLEPIGGDRFQPAGFPEIGHVIYKAPRKNGSTENVCIVDSAASMANHLESVCQRGTHDFDLVDDLDGMPYIRCVTGDLLDGKLPADKRGVVVTSLTEGHRLASSMLLDGRALTAGDAVEGGLFEAHLETLFGIVKVKNAHPPQDRWWDVFKTIFKVDPNSLVHGLLFPQWQIKIPRVLTAHLEAIGAGRVDRSGVKFDKELGPKSDKRVQAIFAADDTTATKICATFVLDVSLIRSFGRKKEEGGMETQLGLSDKQQEFLVALALWKIQKLLGTPFRFRSGCHLRCTALKRGEQEVETDVDIKQAIRDAVFRSEETKPPIVTDVYWPREELYRGGQAEDSERTDGEEEDAKGETE